MELEYEAKLLEAELCAFVAIERVCIGTSIFEFTLVPWRPVLERQIGKEVSGIMRGRDVSWTFGRQRSGPEI